MVRKTLTSMLSRAMQRRGFERHRPERFSKDFEQAYAQTAPFTATSKARMYACWQAAQYVARSHVSGDIVECGVWRGGATMMLATALCAANDVARTIWLYDTFEGMVEPGECDIGADGLPARSRWEKRRREDGVVDWCFAPIEEVRANVQRTAYPTDRFRFVKGSVEDTIPGDVPDEISVLRLDTDWYESTKHELEWLYPRVVRGGVVIIDDYGHWKGARRAVDEYLQAQDARLLLARTDYTGRIAVKAF